MKSISKTERKSDLEISLALNEAIANIPDPEVLFQVIYEMLRPIFHFEVSLIILPLDSNPELGEIFVKGLSLPKDLFGVNTKRNIPVADVLSGFDPSSLELMRFTFSEIHPFKLGLSSELEIVEKKLGVKHFILCPLVHSGKVIGHLILGNGRRGKINDADLPLLRLVSKIIAGAVVSTTAFSKLSQREQDAQRMLNFTTAIMDIHNPQEFYLHLIENAYRLRSFRFGSVHSEFSEDDNGYCALWDVRGMHQIAEDPIQDISAQESGDHSTRVRVSYYDAEKVNQLESILFQSLGICSLVQIILQIEGFGKTVLTFGGDESQAQDLLSPGLFEQVGSQLYLAFHNLHIWDQVQSLKNRLQMENRVLLDEIVPPSNQQHMIGQSPAFRKVLSRARLIAPNDTTVLLLGETGTGKEVFARFLHDSSARHDKPLVRVNCAALPTQLIESELFGHEKGSFTGAVERRLGKFELAQGGSIFLDEIGELPLESQAKLLRVLQEREFERVGGHQALRVDVRVLAATNRDLSEEVRKGTFRSDLYFRLSVFPITLPPLRERPEDIPLLAEVFLHRAAKKLGRILRPLEREELDLLMSYNWPGNIRELEHVIENAAILAKDTAPNLRDFRKLARNIDSLEEGEEIIPLEDTIRSQILKALQQAKGRVGGAQGAAARLGLNAKTLDSKMRKMGIQRKVNYAG